MPTETMNFEQSSNAFRLFIEGKSTNESGLNYTITDILTKFNTNDLKHTLTLLDKSLSNRKLIRSTIL